GERRPEKAPGADDVPVRERLAARDPKRLRAHARGVPGGEPRDVAPEALDGEPRAGEEAVERDAQTPRPDAVAGERRGDEADPEPGARGDPHPHLEVLEVADEPLVEGSGGVERGAADDGSAAVADVVAARELTRRRLAPSGEEE